MNEIRTLCVYAASSSSVPEAYIEAARAVGRMAAERRIRLINGAGRVGLMGACTDACLAAGGHVTGIIPRFMVEEGWCHDRLTECIVTPDMHTRKSEMLGRADAVVALPGGVGTLEELLEAVTWKQLGLYGGPLVIFNAGGYYDPLLRMFDRAVEQRFMRDIHRRMWDVADTPEAVFACLAAARPWDSTNRKLAAL